MKRIIVILIAICVSNTYLIKAQKSTEVSFQKTVHDFGRIQEDGGKVTYKFTFRNNGKKPIIVKNVQSSCGCTTPEWTKTPVLPGKAGFVSAQYDPTGRPGAFNKQITVYNNITSQPIVLQIKGDVIPKKKQIADIYRHKIGALRLKSSHIPFARIYNTETKTQTLDVINDSENTIEISFNDKYIHDHLKISITPAKLAPKQKAVITATYNAAKKNSWGYKMDRVPILINGKPAPGYPLSISATIVEDFSKLTRAELANAPTMDFESKEFNFGTIKQGEKITHEFKFKNNGKRDLIIRETKSSCGCTAVQSKKVVKPGETSTIKATFNSAGKMGKQNKSITLITNIPGKEKTGVDKYKVILRLKGQIEK